MAPKLFSKTASEVINSTSMLWTLVGFGVIAGLWNKRMRASAFFLVGFLAFSLAAFSAGFYFRQHYYIFVLPAASLFTGVAISALPKLTARYSNFIRFALLLFFAVALSQPVLAASKLYFEVSPVEASRMVYRENPFPESVRIAEYLREHTDVGDTIAVLGSEPQIYFYSKRHSATGYIYTYGLMEPQSYARQMQEEMIRQIESARPKYVIFVGVPTSWLRYPESELLIFTWVDQYIKTYYGVVGLVNILSSDRTDYYFDQMPESLPQLGAYALIYQRKS